MNEFINIIEHLSQELFRRQHFFIFNVSRDQKFRNFRRHRLTAQFEPRIYKEG